MNTAIQPAIYVPHGGGPCFFMDWTWGPADTWKPLEGFLRSLAPSLPERPRALLVLTAHWEEPGFAVSAAPSPGMIYDYYNFPEPTYRLNWPAPGAPQLAARAAQLLSAAGLPAAVDPTRGFDHGVFIPMMLAFPEAAIPTVSLSVAIAPDGRFDPEFHLAAGRALAPLRHEGVLIVGSGMSFHNLGAYLHPETTPRARAFDDWLTAAVERPEPERSHHLAAWETAPSGRFSHPREEHLIPLLVAAGAGGLAPGRRVFSDSPMGAAISAYRFDGEPEVSGIK